MLKIDPDDDDDEDSDTDMAKKSFQNDGSTPLPNTRSLRTNQVNFKLYLFCSFIVNL